MANKEAAGESMPDYDFYFSAGANIGTSSTTAPTAGKQWRLLWNVVNTSLFAVSPAPKNAPFTTVMNWQSHKPLQFQGVTYGQKDIEFEKFIHLPELTKEPLEIAVAGKAPVKKLQDYGWGIRNAKEVSQTADAYQDYIRKSRGEFSVCKNIFVETRNGWFSDRSAAYLASGRPVVLQDTGFSRHLPCGTGLFAVNHAEEAAEAIRRIASDYEVHSSAAREIAVEYLDAKKLLEKFLADCQFPAASSSRAR
jgi:hypothetical protein